MIIEIFPSSVRVPPRKMSNVPSPSAVNGCEVRRHPVLQWQSHSIDQVSSANAISPPHRVAVDVVVFVELKNADRCCILEVAVAEIDTVRGQRCIVFSNVQAAACHRGMR